LNKRADKRERAERAAKFFKEYYPLVFLIPTIAYCGVIFYLSSIPSLSIPPPFPHFDKVVHFFEFGGLSVLVVMGMNWAEYDFFAGMRFVVPVVFCFFYGLSDEVHQLFVEGRFFDLTDLAADVAGAACAAGLFLYVLKRIGLRGLKKQGGNNG
jgi:VanZ family protein